MRSLDFPMADVNLSPLLEQIQLGNVILFLGSGFSKGAVGFGGEFPTAKELAGAIGKLGSFESDGDLRYAADRYLRESDPGALTDYLKNQFSVVKTLDHQQILATLPWRRTYTTNYDLCFERAAEPTKRIQTVSLEDRPSETIQGVPICVHINGSILNLSPSSLSSSFKLSASSYLSPDSFLESSWYYAFKRDLDFASAIVFVGYSLYDIEIQKILFSTPALADKTYFICSPEINERERFTLRPFGHVAAIGAAAFAEAIKEQAKTQPADQLDLTLSSIVKYEISPNEVEIRDVDTDRFLMYGTISDSIVDTAILSGTGAPIIVARDGLQVADKLLQSPAPLVVLSDFGNGKSVFLRTLCTRLTQQGNAVYVVESDDEYNHHDLEIISRTPVLSYLIIDSYDQHLDLLRHYFDLESTHLRLILAARSATHESQRSFFKEMRVTPNELPVDQLEITEVDSLIDIIDNVGFWGEDASKSRDQKRKIIVEGHQSQLSGSLLSIIQAPQMIGRLSNLTSELLQNFKFRDTVFSIALLSYLDRPMNFSLISDLALNEEIYSAALLQHDEFRQIFRVNGTSIVGKSSLFAQALLKHAFQPSYVVEQLLKIVEALDKDSDEKKRDIFKSLIKFSSVERIFPEKRRINNLAKYYEMLKRKVPWLKSDPHFWLQYAMTQIAYDDYEKAQKYLDQAYSFAAQKANYHTHPLDTQQARLHLMAAVKEKDSNVSFSRFNSAIILLRAVPADVYKFRTAIRVRDVHQHSFPRFSAEQKSQFVKGCSNLLKEAEDHFDNRGSFRSKKDDQYCAELTKIVAQGSS